MRRTRTERLLSAYWNRDLQQWERSRAWRELRGLTRIPKSTLSRFLNDWIEHGAMKKEKILYKGYPRKAYTLVGPYKIVDQDKDLKTRIFYDMEGPVYLRDYRRREELRTDTIGGYYKEVWRPVGPKLVIKKAAD